ncbi:MAG TPA: glycosyltransferase [Acidimicrobiales bacterium]
MDAARTSVGRATAGVTGVPSDDQPVPPVVAVVVTCDPGWWLEDCLASLAAQDYPELSVLVVDADSAEDPTARVAEVMPSAFVRRVHRRRGFATACNEVLGVVEGASHYVFCHDDVVLAPTAIRLLVEEAFRSNAAVVAPKLVGWFAPDRLLATGMGADSFGVPVALVERGELDQAQHDAVRDVFFAPSPCALVRADLFATLGGFDGGYLLLGEDLDLGWRAHIAGARVVVAPQARVRHLEATESGQRSLDGSLRAASADAEASAAHRGFGAAVFDEDEDVALAPASIGAGGPTSLPGGAAALSAIADDELPPAPDTSEPAWDLRQWDEEEEAGTASAAGPRSAAAHHASRRARREAERDTSYASWAADEDGWDVPMKVARRRARSRQPLAATARPPLEPRGPDADALDDRRAEARLRAISTDCGLARLLTRLPLLLALTIVEAAIQLARRGPAEARRTMHPWSVLSRESGTVRKRRAAVRRTRALSDGEVASLQVGGVTRLRQALRVAVSGDETTGRSGWDSDRRLTVAVWAVGLLVFGYGSRRLLTGHLPTIGELAPWPSWATLVRTAWSGWRTTGLGTAAAAPTGFGLLAAAGVLLLGHTATLQHVLVLGMIPLGALGAARLARPLGSRRAALVALVAYLVVPLPYNALSSGHWSALAAYAALPWIIGLMVRGMGMAPFHLVGERLRGGVASRPDRPARPDLRPLARVAGIALVTALAAAVVPAALVLVVVVGLALAAGTVLTGPVSAATRSVVLAVAGVVGAAVLLVPWSIGWLPPVGEWATFSGPGSPGPALRLATLLRFQTGTLGAGPLGYAVLIVAAFPLVVGRGWRAAWAVRLWMVALASFGLAWAGQHAALGIGWPPADVLLAPAAAALALSAGLGMAAFEIDLAGYNFGWRQAASVIAAAAAVLACLPVLALSSNGRWRQPATGFDAVLSWMPARRADGDFRVLWVGQASVLPIAGWRMGGGLAYATSVDGPPDLTDQWPATSRGQTRLMGQALTLAGQGRTTGLGHLLAPMAVRYVVVVRRPSPLDQAAADTRAVPPGLTGGLDSQLDMDVVTRSDAMTVYENVAWAPMRFEPAPAAATVAGLNDPRAARSVTLGGVPVLPVTHGPTSATGPVAAGAAVEVAQAPSSHWQLRVGGRQAVRGSVWGSANLFSVPAGGTATLGYATPAGWRLALVLQAVLWLLAIGVVVRGRRRPRGAPQAPEPDPVSHEPPVLVAAGRP